MDNITNKITDQRVKDFCNGLDKLSTDTGLKLQSTGAKNVLLLTTPEGKEYEVGMFVLDDSIGYVPRVKDK